MWLKMSIFRMAASDDIMTPVSGGMRQRKTLERGARVTADGATETNQPATPETTLAAQLRPGLSHSLQRSSSATIWRTSRRFAKQEQHAADRDRTPPYRA